MRLFVQDGQWIVQDNSQGKTFINGKAVEGTAALRVGDVIALGSGANPPTIEIDPAGAAERRSGQPGWGRSPPRRRRRRDRWWAFPSRLRQRERAQYYGMVPPPPPQPRAAGARPGRPPRRFALVPPRTRICPRSAMCRPRRFPLMAGPPPMPPLQAMPARQPCIRSRPGKLSMSA